MPKPSSSTQSGSSRQCSGPAEEAGLSWWHPQGQVPRPCPAIIAEGPRHLDPASPQAPQFSSVQSSPPVVSSSLRTHGLQHTRLLCPRGLPGKNSGVGCYFLLQEIFPTQRSKPGQIQSRLDRSLFCLLN